jgi:hypothetical protein
LIFRDHVFRLNLSNISHSSCKVCTQENTVTFTCTIAFLRYCVISILDYNCWKRRSSWSPIESGTMRARDIRDNPCVRSYYLIDPIRSSSVWLFHFNLVMSFDPCTSCMITCTWIGNSHDSTIECVYRYQQSNTLP